MKTLFYLCLVAFLVSCASDEKRVPSSDYSINFESPSWQLIEHEEYDKAYINNDSGKVLMANSHCDAFQNESLETIARRELIGLRNVQLLQAEEGKDLGRESYHIMAKGTLDGVPINVKTITLRKDHCLYDFAMINPKEISQKDLELLNQFLLSVEFD